MLTLLIIIPLTLIIILGLWVYNVDSEIQRRLETKNFIRPTIYYSAAVKIAAGDYFNQFNKSSFNKFRQRQIGENLFPEDYAIWTGDHCRTQLPNLDETTTQCFVTFLPKLSYPKAASEQLQLVALNSEDQVLAVFAGTPFTQTQYFYLPPLELAQYAEGAPIKQKLAPLSAIPSACLNAVTAIEDQNFLQHSGVSPTGIARALLKNIISQRAAQGGSTITQQLAKNYFLTPEKTIKRKFTEFFMALLLEGHLSKDKILETYLNVIYLGQQGSSQIRGYGAAAEYYFNQPISSLELADCALLAAIVNSPGTYNPWKKPENAIRRRALVLDKMLSLNLITEAEKKQALETPLPLKSSLEISATAPYFFEAAARELASHELPTEGLKVFTTLYPQHQQAAQTAVTQHLAKFTDKKNLEGTLISADNETGAVLSLVGGRSFKFSQFNRVLDAQRSIGSTAKPFVYLTAALAPDKLSEPFSPLLKLVDEKFTHRYEGQSWSPDNYDKKFYGTVPIFFALKNSLNVATGKLGLTLGTDRILQTLRKLHITSNIPEVPSISLGSFAVKSTELLQAYLILARYGEMIPIYFVEAAIDDSEEIVYQHQSDKSFVFPQEVGAQIVNLLQQTLISGTAKSAASLGVDFPAAGKTGTTNDNRDTWFAGFSPRYSAVAWTGYDDNKSTGLTGASGALPIWASYMSQVVKAGRKMQFPIPETCELKTINYDDLEKNGFNMSLFKQEEVTDLLFCD